MGTRTARRRFLRAAGTEVLAFTAALGPVAPPAQAALPLAGKIVALNPGHDGGNASHPAFINQIIYAGNGIWKACDTVGTTTRAGYSEHALTWDVAIRTAAILRTEGAKVVLTRGTDTGAGPCVNTRAQFANASLANAVVSIHADGSFVTGARGFHVIYPGRRAPPTRSVNLRHGWPSSCAPASRTRR